MTDKPVCCNALLGSRRPWRSEHAGAWRNHDRKTQCSVTCDTTVGQAKDEWQRQLECGEGRSVEGIWPSRREPVPETAKQKPHNGLTYADRGCVSRIAKDLPSGFMFAVGHAGLEISA